MENFSLSKTNVSPNKSKRGRFVIQETEILNDDEKIENNNNTDNNNIENNIFNINTDNNSKNNNNNNDININITTFESSPKLSELLVKEIKIVNPKLKTYRSTSLAKKRRSASFSKFQINSKEIFSLNQNNNKFYGL